MSGPRQQQQAQNGEFSVTIVACGPIDAYNLVYAITVSQPVTSWTVVRSQDDFKSLYDALRNSIEISAVPALMGSEDLKDTSVLVQARNELQAWFSNILRIPGALSSNPINTFLTIGANTIPEACARVVWTRFDEVQPAPADDGMEMQMDDMYDDDDNRGNLQYEDYDDEDERPPPASVRYQQMNEHVTFEDTMELTGEVEMIDDIGSLAQSLGASHLGKSLQLQQETAQPQLRNFSANNVANKGLTIGGSSHNSDHSGGIGVILERAQESDSPASTPTPRLDNFGLIKVIGKGSFGKVFLVKEHSSGTIYALKVLRKDNIIKRNQVEHTNTERSVLGYVKHPFIVGMNMAFQSKDKLYFVLDYCAGGELFFHLGKEGKFKEPRARFYAAEIVCAISYVHSLDIIYRDLKPENVLLDAQGHIRLTDFGLSKEGISSSSSGANSFCGTPEYLAPEILNQQGHGRAVDWWSLGAVVYEMLAGLPPFYSQDRQRLFQMIRKSDLRYPSSMSKPAEEVLRGLLIKDPNRRLGSGPRDAEDIKEMEFFKPIDFEKLMKGELEAPWRPDIKSSLDTSQFDNEFTRMPILSPHQKFGATPDDKLFQGFSFTDKRRFRTRAGVQ